MKYPINMLQKLVLVGGTFLILLMIIVSCKDKAAPLIASGEEIYQSHCQICHGDAADGHGPMAGLLKVEPPDLRLIAQRNGGKFDKDAVFKIIDGTNKMTEGHGDSEMPIWSVVFANETDASEIEVPLKIDELVKYLETLQLKNAN